ncbi:MAG TPA: hypothetical protein VGS27_36160 [Candidatus Sulfotelmatobacter sp.]|nr:hypothetical protein [Candidatus Sulfotelmatobacter sp.]
MAGGNGETAAIAFELWKEQLRKDCQIHDKLAAFDAMGEYVLHLLWESGIEPSVQSIVANTAPHSSGGNFRPANTQVKRPNAS